MCFFFFSGLQSSSGNINMTLHGLHLAGELEKNNMPPANRKAHHRQLLFQQHDDVFMFKRFSVKSHPTMCMLNLFSALLQRES